MDDFQATQLSNPRAGRRTYLVTYSRADFNKFPTCSRQTEKHTKSRHYLTIKSVVKLPMNPRIWKTLLKAHFQ